jgi:tetratricopeptide (TPR) repeat protein
MSKPLLTAIAIAVFALPGCAKDPQVAKREYVKSGDAYLAQKKYREATVEYRNAIQQDPQFIEARQKLADTYMELGDLRNGFQEYVRLADLQPNNADAQVKVGEMLLVGRSFQDAQSRADKALASNPTHVGALILRANALAGLHKVDDAVLEVEQAIQADPDRSESYASLGMMQLMRGDRAQAESAFTRAVRTNPNSVAARLALGNFYAVAGRRPEAEAEFTAALKIEPKNLLANRAMAYYYIASGRAALAEPNLKMVADVAPNSLGKLILADYYVSMGRPDDSRKILEVAAAADDESSATAKLRLSALGLVSGGDSASAARLVDEVLAKSPSHVDALIAKSALLARAGKLDEALKTARAAVDANPRSANAQFALGKVLTMKRDDVAAIKAFNDALQLNPRLANPEVELARLYMAQGKLSDAERFAQSAVTKVAGYVDAHLLLARIYLLQGAPAKAEPSLRALAKALPDSPTVQTEVGMLELSKRNRPAARAAFERALAKNPTFVEALAGLNQMDLEEKRTDSVKARTTQALRAKPKDGPVLILASRTYSALGDLATTEKLLQEAIAANPNNLDAYALLGQVYTQQRRLPEATAQFEKWAEKQPKSVGAYTVTGVLLDMQNRPADARAKYERALEIDPRAAVAANNLAWIYAESGGNLDMALQLAQIAKSQLPDQPEVNDTLGWIYHKKGLSSLAVPALLQSVEKDPKNAVYLYHLGMAYAGNGDKDKARAALEKALALDANFNGAAQAREALLGLKG